MLTSSTFTYILLLGACMLPFGIYYLFSIHRNRQKHTKTTSGNELSTAAMNNSHLLQSNIEKKADGKNILKTERQQMSESEQQMMARMDKYIKENIGDPDLKIEDIANAVNLSRTVFYERMKSLTEMSPSDYLRHVRMQRAKELVATSDMTFSQIAYQVGFTDPKYFRICFKKETGVTPSEFRRTSQ
ncbi:MAG: helix-turn-helix domain-containing protein [Prevotella sp.]|nr:helix-turn-helix domain-containing protein [Prevotella sp.]